MYRSFIGQNLATVKSSRKTAPVGPSVQHHMEWYGNWETAMMTCCDLGLAQQTRVPVHAVL